jgi:hypothetical protein
MQIALQTPCTRGTPIITVDRNGELARLLLRYVYKKRFAGILHAG